MSDLSFGIHLVASTLAAGAAYGLLMAVFKKEVGTVMFRRLASFAFTCAIVSVAAGGLSLLSSSSIVLKLSGMVLAGGLGCSLGLLVFDRLKAGLGPVYPERSVSAIRSVSVVLFVLLITHVLLLFADLGQV